MSAATEPRGPWCRFGCERQCWHAEFVPLVKRSKIKGRCAWFLRKKKRTPRAAEGREGV